MSHGLLNTYWWFVLILLINNICLVISTEAWKETKKRTFVVTGYFKVPLESIDCNVLIFCITVFMVLMYNYLFMALIYLYIYSRNANSQHICIFLVYSGILFLVSYIFVSITVILVVWNQNKTGVYFLILALLLCIYFSLRNVVYIYIAKEIPYSQI